MVNWRYKICYILFFSFFLIILIRLFYWQVLLNKEFKNKADQQRKFTQELKATRGEIFSNDNSPLVLNTTAYLLYADLPQIKEKPKTIAEKLAPIIVKNNLNFDDEKYETRLKNKINFLSDRLSGNNLVWVSLSPKISQEDKKKISRLKIKGLGFQEIPDRSYPEASTAGQLLGFVGKDDGGKDIGYFGLEGYYDKKLRGKSGKIFGDSDVFGIPIIFGQFFKQKAMSGDSLILNLNLSIQKVIDEELKRGILAYQAKGGTAIVIDPNNGAILAMSSFPSFDLSDWSNYGEASYKNPAISDYYEPGSILKPIIMSMAINDNKVKPDTKCDNCSGPVSVGGYLIRTYNDKYHPNTTMMQVLENSDNTGMVFVGKKIGASAIYDYLTKFGFGKPTGIDIQGEIGGNLHPLNDWYEIDKSTVTFGQGIGVTSIQMAEAFSALANGGKIYEPQIVNKILTGNNKEIKMEPKLIKQVIKPETAKVITEMLVSVCEKSELHLFKDQIPELKNYRIAAKSGTAQISVGGKYAENKTIGTVIGYAPADKPKFLVLVKLTEAEVNQWGSNTAGPLFFNIMKDLLVYYGI